MYKKTISNFSGGLNTALAALQLGLDSKKTSWSEALNVEIFNQQGVCRQKGNTQLTQTPEGQGVTSLYTITPQSDKNKQKVLYSTDLGEFYEYDCSTNTHKQLKTGLTPAAACFYAPYIGGVAVANGVDEPFFYKFDGTEGSLHEMKTIAKDGESKIIPNAMCAYKSRLWLAQGNTIYFSALGMFDDWDSALDAGFISNFHCDDAPIKALSTYKDYLAVYKGAQTYLLSGNSPEDFAITPFADKGAAGVNAVVTAENKQYFFSDGLFNLEQTGLLAQISLGNEATLAIKPTLNGLNNTYYSFSKTEKSGNVTHIAGGALDKTRLSQVIALSYERKNQLWFYVPTQNNEFLNNVWIYDRVAAAWTLRAAPQPVTCAANFDETLICGTSDGRILIEDSGSTFDGVPIEFVWKSPFLSLGNPNERKIIDDFYFLISDRSDNNFLFRAYKDYDTLDAQDHEHIVSENRQNMIWGGEVETSERYNWAQESDTSASPIGEDLTDSSASPVGEDLTDSSACPDDLSCLDSSSKTYELAEAGDDVSSDGLAEAGDSQKSIREGGNWSISAETAQKAEISGSSIAVQFCIYGNEPQHDFTLLALEFKEITED